MSKDTGNVFVSAENTLIRAWLRDRDPKIGYINTCTLTIEQAQNLVDELNRHIGWARQGRDKW